MGKEIKAVGLNVVAIDKLGQITPLNAEVYSTEGDIKKAFESGELSVAEGFAGFCVLEVFQYVEVKAKAEPKAKEEPKAKTPKDGGNPPPPAE